MADARKYCAEAGASVKGCETPPSGTDFGDRDQSDRGIVITPIGGS
jgi:hypothetical protein